MGLCRCRVRPGHPRRPGSRLPAAAAPRPRCPCRLPAGRRGAGRQPPRWRPAPAGLPSVNLGGVSAPFTTTTTTSPPYFQIVSSAVGAAGTHPGTRWFSRFGEVPWLALSGPEASPPAWWAAQQPSPFRWWFPVLALSEGRDGPPVPSARTSPGTFWTSAAVPFSVVYGSSRIKESFWLE